MKKSEYKREVCSFLRLTEEGTQDEEAMAEAMSCWAIDVHPEVHPSPSPTVQPREGSTGGVFDTT